MNKIFTDIVDVFNKEGNKVTQLILINILVFFTFSLVKFGVSLFPNSNITVQHVTENVLISSDFKSFILHPWTILFHAFTHNSLWSLIFDMLLLYWFGNMLSDLLGGKKAVGIYIISALYSVAIFMLFWSSLKAIGINIPTEPYLYGISAGVFGIMVAYVTLNPDSEVMFFTLRVKVRIIVFLFLVLSLFKSPSLGTLDLSGAFVGFLSIYLLKRGTNIASWVEKLVFNRKQPKKLVKTYSSKIKGTKVIPFSGYDVNQKPTQEEVDFLLDKINKEGYQALTKEEKQRLHRASQSAD